MCEAPPSIPDLIIRTYRTLIEYSMVLYMAWWLIKLGTEFLISNRSLITQIFSDAQEQKQRASPFPVLVSAKMTCQTYNNNENTQRSYIFSWWDFSRNFLWKYILGFGLNSFQQSKISQPFSRFIIDFVVISFPELRQKKIWFFDFLFLRSTSDSRNILLSRLMFCKIMTVRSQ